MLRANHIVPGPSAGGGVRLPARQRHAARRSIFGATGGVMDAALRSAYYLVTGENPDPDAFTRRARHGRLEGGELHHSCGGRGAGARW